MLNNIKSLCVTFISNVYTIIQIIISAIRWERNINFRWGISRTFVCQKVPCAAVVVIINNRFINSPRTLVMRMVINLVFANVVCGIRRKRIERRRLTNIIATIFLCYITGTTTWKCLDIETGSTRVCYYDTKSPIGSCESVAQWIIIAIEYSHSCPDSWNRYIPPSPSCEHVLTNPTPVLSRYC